MSNQVFFPEKWLSKNKTSADWIGLRWVNEITTTRSIRNDRPEQNATHHDEGVILEVLVDGHIGYAATSDLSDSGLDVALQRAKLNTGLAAPYKVAHLGTQQRPVSKGRYISPRLRSLDSLAVEELISILMTGSSALAQGPEISNRLATTTTIQTTIRQLSSAGADLEQIFDMVSLDLQATAVRASEMHTRTLHGFGAQTSQIGAEIFDRHWISEEGSRIGREALELLDAANCPSEKMDLLLMPDQMMLQIHESIGHPLELDRILGDERNYAGWSFIQPTDFGQLQYGSSFMNVTFDPSRQGQLASYAFDDGAAAATKEYLIQNGVLVRGLGGLESQSRTGLKGVANFRASSWNRAPIDRMANINLEPGQSSLEHMIENVQRGILMTSNRSWSIDDYRNKFQFGCEYGKLIEDGKLTKTIKNPNYRGTTVNFWNRLAQVGASNLVKSYGTIFCGKGEPNQAIRVGHASPPCLFREVEVFGGHS